jgi:hypothetical protein
VVRDSLLILSYDRRGALLNTSAPILGTSRAILAEVRTTSQSRTIASTRATPLPVVREPPIAVGAMSYYVHRDVESEIDVYSASGALRATVRVEPHVRNRRYVPSRLGVVLGDSATVGGFLTDDAGNLWYELDETPTHAIWWVLGPTGSLLGEVRTPAGFRVLDIRLGFITGVRVGDDGDVVQAYSLRRRL